MRPNLIVDPFFFAQAEYLIIASGGYCSYVNADVVITYVIEGKFFKSRDYVYANMVPQVETPAAWYMALVFFLCNLPQVIVRASKVIGLALYGTNLGDARRLIYEMDDDDEESTLAAMLLQFPHTIDVLTVPASEAPAAAMPETEVAKSFEVAAPAEAVAPAAASEPAAAESEPAAALALAAHVASSSASPAGAPPMKRARTEKESARPEVSTPDVTLLVYRLRLLSHFSVSCRSTRARSPLS